MAKKPMKPKPRAPIAAAKRGPSATATKPAKTPPSAKALRKERLKDVAL